MKNEKKKKGPAGRVFVRVGPRQKPVGGGGYPPRGGRPPGVRGVVFRPTRGQPREGGNVQTSELEKWLPPSRLTSARLPP